MRKKNGVWLEFRGVRSDSLGVRVLRLPDRPRPAARGQRVSVPGRSGSLWIPGGAYEDVKLSCELLVPEGKQTEVASWLSGAGLLRSSVWPNLCYRARAADRFEYRRILPGSGDATAIVTFEAEPFLYQYPASSVTLTAPGLVANPGTVAALPRVTVVGSGNVALLMGGKTLLIDSISGSVVIDSEAKIAHSGAQLWTGKLSGDWPEIPPGGAAVGWTGNVTRVEVEVNARYL